MRLLILTASAGNGHNSAARAIENAAVADGVCCRTIDLLDITAPLFKRWFKGGYETLVKHNPKLWGRLYRSSDRPLFNFWFQTALDRVFCAPLDRIVSKERPDWIVCTHSLPQPRLAMLRRKHGFRIAVVVTDLHPHLMWLRGKPDLYLAATEETARLLKQRRPSSRIQVVGMPIDEAFTFRTQLPASASVLVAAGGIGGGPVFEVAQALSSLPAQVVVLCGRNEGLRQRLQFELPAVSAVGHLSSVEVAEHFRRSSFIVSKPGGLTTFEAINCGLPFLIYGPLVIPGQEEDNAKFLLEIGAARSASSLTELVRISHLLLGDAPALLAMSEAGRKHAGHKAAYQVLNALANPPATTRHTQTNVQATATL